MAETYRRLLRESGLPELEARMLLETAASRPRTWLLARLDEQADEAVEQMARRLYARRHAGEPIAYITGEREFYSLELRITSDVLIPRPETELLVEVALTVGPQGGGRAIDLGTGSGAIAVALAHHAPDMEIWAVDISEIALVVATRNAERHGAAVRFVCSDWFKEVPAGRFDLIVSNPPYIAEDDKHLGQGDLRFEPRLALTGGPDGLDCIRRIAHESRNRLEVGGWLLFEHGYDQAERCHDLLAAYGYSEIRNWKDLAGHVRITGGRLL
ncbi:MAG TPA: peptide chain release factor N(5)-glutamine methyltransferase [Burkholderiales bacterium]|nr:peptide chain release factor N(5)-glutamine methyltransferase [Burkholderiales bacterium]